MIGNLSISILLLSLLLETTGKSSMVSFWSSSALTARIEQLKHAEAKLLQLARRYAASSGDVYDIRAFDTMIPRSCIPSLKPSKKEGDELVIHAVQVQTKTNQASDSHGETSVFPLVALHGYYNGAAYYYRNLLGLASYFQNVYSLDCLGWGLSSRPKYSNLKRGNSVESAEEWFVESLEAWREANKIERMVLLGHSFGGYMSVAYAERYPHRVERLLLLSPVGVPDENDPSFQERKQRFTSTFRSRMFVGTFQQLFDWTTVGGFLRTFVSEDRAYNMAGNYVQGRLTSIEARDEQEAITDYLYNNAMAQGSGEYTVHAILTNNILARRPLQHRIPKLQVKNVSMFYGQYDWMDMSGALHAQKLCKNAGDEAPNVKVYMVPNSGHLLMLENPEGTNAALIEGAGGRRQPFGPIAVEADEVIQPDSATRRIAIQRHQQRQSYGRIYQ